LYTKTKKTAQMVVDLRKRDMDLIIPGIGRTSAIRNSSSSSGGSSSGGGGIRVGKWAMLLLLMALFSVVLVVPNRHQKKMKKLLLARGAVNPGKSKLSQDSSFPSSVTTSSIGDQIITNRPDIQMDGTLKSATDMSPFQVLRPFDMEQDKETRGWDNEGYDAITRYFWGQTHGIVLELGALDGKRFSVSADFLPLQWHRILMEASPRYAENGPSQSPDATYIASAICNEQKTVHYLFDRRSGAAGGINGIGEFMSRDFLKRMHPLVFQATKHGTDFTAVSDWKQWSTKTTRASVEEIPCVDLATIFRAVNVSHVNLEGAEMQVLSSIDWNSMRFDVLAIETEPFNENMRPRSYFKTVRTYLSQYGYIFEQNIGRNSWFRHESFQPAKKPLS
jgi:hypothetical protein